MRATFAVQSAVADQMKALGDQYDAVHIRHTDYRMAYEPYLLELKPRLAGRRVLICSDNIDVLQSAQALLSQSSVLIIESSLALLKAQKVRGRPMHYQWHLPLHERRQRNLAMLTDLVALSFADRLHYSTVSRIGWVGYSGFVRLAEQLAQRQDVRTRWLGI